MLTAVNVSKSFGTQSVFQDVSFSLQDGQSLGILGKDGAGKSTLLQIAAGYLYPTTGKVLFDGIDVKRKAARICTKMGYFPQNAPLYPELTVQEFLEYCCQAKKVPANQMRQRRNAIARFTGLESDLHVLISRLPLEARYRAALAGALAGNPQLLILDSPTQGLEPKDAQALRGLLRQLATRCTLLLATRSLREVLDVCSHAIVLNGGKSTSPTALSQIQTISMSDHRLKLVCQATRVQMEALIHFLGDVEHQLSNDSEPNCFEVTFFPGQDDLRPAIWKYASEHHMPIRELRQLSLSMEDIFLQLTGNAGEARK